MYERYKVMFFGSLGNYRDIHWYSNKAKAKQFARKEIRRRNNGDTVTIYDMEEDHVYRTTIRTPNVILRT